MNKECISLPSGALLDFRGPALVMAIVNCTDDSFYPASRNNSQEEALARALKAEEDGANIIDFGGESTRPGATYVSEEEELRRLVPVIREFRKRSHVPISVDTRKAAIAKAVLDAGADIINDISALEDDSAMGPLCAERGAVVVLMHKKGIPETMQDEPYYTNVVSEVYSYLIETAAKARNLGIHPQRIMLDPGIGFGKQLEDNLDLIAHLEELSASGYPILVGLSRKRFIGEVCGRDSQDRLAGTLAANAASLMGKAHILRVHDVPETVDLVKMFYAISNR
ncbi:MAG: dihydropteroate synthase [Treponema sp.]|jgi:dihydropteroate synthase|nr:dihydropteroate synthase [Treponema sp.]